MKQFFAPGSLLSYKGYRQLWISSVLVTLGAAAFPIALAVTVLDAGATATTLGLILAARVLSAVLFGLVGGVWTDRLPRKHVMIGADIYRGLLMLALVFVATPQVAPWILGALVFLMGIGEAFGMPASGAILPSLLPDELLPAGNVMRGVSARIATVVGPGLGGFSVALIGGRLTFGITALFFFAGTALLFSIHEKPRQVNDKSPSFISELREGVVAVWHIPWVAAIIGVCSMQLMLVLAGQGVLLPIITRRQFHSNTVFALAEVAFSLGAVVSAVFAVKYKAKHPGLVSMILWSFFAVTPLVLAFPISPAFVLIGFMIGGISIGPWEAYWNTALQREIPTELQGRVFSVDYMGSTALMPLGFAIVGPVTQVIGEKPFLLGAVIFHVTLCALVLLVPGVKDMRAPQKLDSSQGEQVQA